MKSYIYSQKTIYEFSGPGFHPGVSRKMFAIVELPNELESFDKF